MNTGINDTGAWTEPSEEAHFFDESLAARLATWFEAKTVLDLGCGPGDYVKFMRRRGVEIWGYDGNPYTHQLSGGICHYRNLIDPLRLAKRDWVISLEVGEHIPEEFEQKYIDNICGVADWGLVLSWAVVGQPGHGHVNCRDNDYVVEQVEQRGFKIQWERSKELREASSLPWFKKTLMVFRNMEHARN